MIDKKSFKKGTPFNDSPRMHKRSESVIYI